MARHGILHEIFSAYESAEAAYRADGIDEYRELAMLAHAWERGSLKPGVAAVAPDPGNEKDSRRPGFTP